MTVRDLLGELFPDAESAPGFGVRGRPGWSPGRSAALTAASGLVVAARMYETPARAGPDKPYRITRRRPGRSTG